MIPALPEVEAYAARILGWVDAVDLPFPVHAAIRTHLVADRRRVERDVEGLRDHHEAIGYCVSHLGSTLTQDWPCPDALRYWTDLTEVGALYGQPWEVQP